MRTAPKSIREPAFDFEGFFYRGRFRHAVWPQAGHTKTLPRVFHGEVSGEGFFCALRRTIVSIHRETHSRGHRADSHDDSRSVREHASEGAVQRVGTFNLGSDKVCRLKDYIAEARDLIDSKLAVRVR